SMVSVLLNALPAIKMAPSKENRPRIPPCNWNTGSGDFRTMNAPRATPPRVPSKATQSQRAAPPPFLLATSIRFSPVKVGGAGNRNITVAENTAGEPDGLLPVKSLRAQAAEP